MELREVDIIRSPGLENRVRLIGTVAYDDKACQPETYWFDIPEKYAEFLTDTGNPWLALLLPLAVTLGEPLRISRPIDPLLFENVHELMLIWKLWYPSLSVIPVEAEVISGCRSGANLKAGSFFSGGVDSFFTVLRHENKWDIPGRIQIEDLICVWGWDILLQNKEAFDRMRDVMKRVALDLGKELIDVATNVRDTRWWNSGYGRLSHGPAMASIGLAFERKYNKVLIPSTAAYNNLHPNGSHPLTDPLLSTKGTKIIHDGSGYNRVEKTELVARSEVALRSLRVCWEGHSDKNCQACNKCYRTMITLMLLGALSRCSTFSESNLELGKIPRIYSKDDNDFSMLREVQTLALGKGRRDIARAIGKSFQRSKCLNSLLPIIRSLRKKRFVGRLSAALEHRILSKSLL